MKRIIFSMIFLAMISIEVMAQKFEHLAETPPMGWNSWGVFNYDINEQVVMEIADAMVTSGMQAAGYEYVVIDDCWAVGRDSVGNLIADPEKFPSGMKALAGYVHSKGLKLGIYSDGGTQTCQGRPGSRGYEFQDARTFASWGIDYLKYDWCNSQDQNTKASYRLMRDALYKAGRPIVFSICEWGSTQPWLWAKDIGHLWRTGPDIKNCFSCELNWGAIGVMEALDRVAPLRRYSGPGHWNDPDYLQVGNKGLTLKESQAQFGLWSMLPAPIMATNDLRNMSPEITELLTNNEVLAINKDTLFRPAIKYADYGDLEIWLKPLANGDYALGILNRGENKIMFDKSLQLVTYDLAIKPNSYTYRIDEHYKIRDLWKHKEIGTTKDNFKAEIESHELVLLRLHKTE